MSTRAIVSFSLLVLAGCPAEGTGKPAPKTAAAAPADKAPEAKPAVVAAADAADEAAGDKGCIYAEGEDKSKEPACPGGNAEPDAPADGDGHFGSPFTLAKAVSLTSAIDGGGETAQLIEGEVEAVCQKKGCWMVIKDGTNSARVLMKDHGFAVPMDSRGKKVVVEGTLASRTFTEEQVKHLAKDGGKDPGEVSGTRTEHVLTASGVKIGPQS